MARFDKHSSGARDYNRKMGWRRSKEKALIDAERRKKFDAERHKKT